MFFRLGRRTAILSDTMAPTAKVRLRRDVSSAETCGFATYIILFPVSAAYLIWAFAPGKALQSAGITYYPPQEIAAHLPTLAIALFIAAPIIYAGLNFLSAPAPSSLDTLWDEYAREARFGSGKLQVEEDSTTTDEICDIDVGAINRLLLYKRIQG